MVKTATAYTVTQVVQETRDVRTWRFAFGDGPFRFRCGEFVLAGLPGDEDKTAALTISSSPLDPEGFELTVKRSGEFGTAFYDNVGVGAQVPIVGRPSGKPVPDGAAFCVIGRDYSIPAARSLARWLVDANDPRPLVVLHEVTEEDVLYGDELKRMPHVNHRVVRAARVTGPRVVLAVARPAETAFFVAGEGEDVRFWRDELKPLALAPSQLVLERWS